MRVSVENLNGTYTTDHTKATKTTMKSRFVFVSSFLSLFNTVPLHSLKCNSQRLNRCNHGLVLVTNWSKESIQRDRNVSAEKTKSHKDDPCQYGTRSMSVYRHTLHVIFSRDIQKYDSTCQLT